MDMDSWVAVPPERVSFLKRSNVTFNRVTSRAPCSSAHVFRGGARSSYGLKAAGRMLPLQSTLKWST